MELAYQISKKRTVVALNVVEENKNGGNNKRHDFRCNECAVALTLCTLGIASPKRKPYFRRANKHKHHQETCLYYSKDGGELAQKILYYRKLGYARPIFEVDLFTSSKVPGNNRSGRKIIRDDENYKINDVPNYSHYYLSEILGLPISALKSIIKNYPDITCCHEDQNIAIEDFIIPTEYLTSAKHDNIIFGLATIVFNKKNNYSVIMNDKSVSNNMTISCYIDKDYFSDCNKNELQTLFKQKSNEGRREIIQNCEVVIRVDKNKQINGQYLNIVALALSIKLPNSKSVILGKKPIKKLFNSSNNKKELSFEELEDIKAEKLVMLQRKRISLEEELNLLKFRLAPLFKSDIIVYLLSPENNLIKINSFSHGIEVFENLGYLRKPKPKNLANKIKIFFLGDYDKFPDQVGNDYRMALRFSEIIDMIKKLSRD
jgi:hypothetical protein